MCKGRRKKYVNIEKEEGDSDNYIHTIITAENLQLHEGEQKGEVKVIQSGFKMTMLVNNQSLKVKLDTGASYLVMDYDEYRTKFPELKLNSNTCRLRTVNGKPLQVMGQINVTAVIKKTEYRLSLIIIKSEKAFTSIIGRNWLDVIIPD
jgi:predicted aspartyl protease